MYSSVIDTCVNVIVIQPILYCTQVGRFKVCWLNIVFHDDN